MSRSSCSSTESSEFASSSTFRLHSNDDDDPEVKEDQDHQCNLPVRTVAAAGEPSRGRGRRVSRDSDKTAQCARITTENERARTEAEAAGCHVKDYATGYGTTTTMTSSGGGKD
ncbi:uncharacterized protein Z519_04094 [Cladophialophora bantiana CBS 173.52]|uniref:Uncharacterized protein n=1 Tax=Cladophialophora bantiana (strain ATCC 10958 / CBS 173.52 / CDC B-1940 / NIH 8579) TaxID=1442370 RepID=A0A0D2IFH7_CLAB1|nr:uncharacterized protein Z519_04094 [Cladophialophora bantiana CBS 173.52]KIW95509.1 hypothetical protein Z519_04094 [Cladophialophora bantiana CBS 173.52]